MEILFITSNRVGDAVLTTGVYGWLAETWPQARFTVACGPLAAPLFASAPGLARLHVLTKRRFAAHWVELWRRTASVRWDMVVDLRDSAVSRLIFARRRFVMRPAPKDAPPMHKVAALARLLGVAPPPAPRLWLTDAARTAAAAMLGGAGDCRDADGRLLLALAPTANWTAKEWPADRFADAARRLTAPDGLLPGARTMVLAAPGAEAARARRVVDALPPESTLDLIGRTDPLIAAACIARCSLFIGNDSGLMHIAAAVGAPTLGLFGPGFPEIYGPWDGAGDGRAAAVVGDEPGAALRARVTAADKAPPGLMDGVSVAAVIDKASRLLAAHR